MMESHHRDTTPCHPVRHTLILVSSIANLKTLQAGAALWVGQLSAVNVGGPGPAHIDSWPSCQNQVCWCAKRRNNHNNHGLLLWPTTGNFIHCSSAISSLNSLLRLFYARNQKFKSEVLVCKAPQQSQQPWIAVVANNWKLYTLFVCYFII